MWIEKAVYRGDYKILCTFEDGKNVLADFKEFLTNTSMPQLKQYLNLDVFQKFHVEYGSLSWEGNLFDIYGDDIYNGEFSQVQ